MVRRYVVRNGESDGVERQEDGAEFHRNTVCEYTRAGRESSLAYFHGVFNADEGGRGEEETLNICFRQYGILPPGW